jgi:hypothetical protein
MAIAIAGLIALMRLPKDANDGEGRATRLIVLGWIASARLFLIYSFARLGAKMAGIVLPTIVPSFHFFFYLKAAMAVLFGVGLTAIGRLAVAGVMARAVAAAVCLVLLIAQAKTYTARADFEPARRESLAVKDSDQVRAFAWMQLHLLPTDVVLTNDRDAATIVAPTGAKVVSIFTGFSNPYVDFDARKTARDQMFEALEKDDDGAFRPLAERYHVSYVLTRGKQSTQFDAHPPRDLQLTFSTGELRIYSVIQRSAGAH